MPAYAQVNGRLPLNELARPEGTVDPVDEILYVMGEIDVSEGGEVQFVLDSADGITAWIEDDEVGSQPQFIRQLDPGRHRVVFRVDLNERDDPGVKLEVRRASGSSAEVVVVDGM